MATGTLFGGERLIGRPVTFDGSDGIHLRILDGEGLAFPLEDVRVSDRLGNVTRFIYLPGAAVIETLDNDAVDAWFSRHRRGRLAAAIHALESHRVIATIACALLVALIGIGAYYGPPKLAAEVARRVPRAIDDRAGTVALASLDQWCPASTLATSDRERVQAQLTRVMAAHPGLPRPTLIFRHMPGGPNAFALPGGRIVVADELVNLPATDDEIAAVLAHEMGHVEFRHGVQTVLRGSLALLFVSAVTGDLSVLTSFVGALPTTILTNGYSRNFEREADRYALATMKACGISPRNFSTMLFKLREVTSGTHDRSTVNYLSTHPADEERMAMFGRLTDRDEQLLKEAVKPRPRVFNAPAPVPQPHRVQVKAGRLPEVAVKPDIYPVATKRVAPIFPVTARAAGRTGTVTVDFVVLPDGSVDNPYAISSTDSLFDSAAVEAVRQWTFKPGMKNGRPMPVHMQVPIVFTLEDEEAP